MKSQLLATLSIAMTAGLPAAVVKSGIKDLAIPITFDGIYLDFDDVLSPTTVTTSFTEPTNWDINLFFGGAAIATSDTLQPVTASTATNAAVLGFSSGEVIDGNDAFPASHSGSLDHMGPGSQQWSSGARKYIGFQFQPSSFPADANQPTGPIYGWMEVTLTNDGTEGTIHQWAWDTSGAPIIVPEPGTTTLAALALLGLAARRRR